MTRLKRVGGQIQQIPNGLYFRQPEINWDSRKVLGLHPSFETLVGAVISARTANPHHVQQHNWSLDRTVVSGEVEAFLVRICLSMGWTNFVAEIGGGSPPVPFPQSVSPQDQNLLSAAANKAKKLWAGVKTLNAWLDSEEPPVPTEQSEKRAATCVACPLNGSGDLTSWFTTPAAAAIKRQMERMQKRNISGTQDAKLGVCSACLCPLVLKTKTPMKFIKPNLSDEVIKELMKGKDCWIVTELGG